MQSSRSEGVFCCRGCETASLILQDEKDLRETLQARRGKIEVDFAQMDHELFEQRYVEKRSDSVRRVRLVVEGIYCVSCVFAIEKLSVYLPGVLQSRVNLTTSVVVIDFDGDRIPLSEIARTLFLLGYRPHPADEDRLAKLDCEENRKRLIHLAVAGACAGNAMLIAFAMYYGLFTGMSEEYLHLFRWTSAGLATVSLVWPGSVFYRSAWRALRAFVPHMDLPVAVGLTAGAGLGIANTIRGQGEIYFDSITILVFLLLVGRYIQYRQQRKAIHQISFAQCFSASGCSPFYDERGRLRRNRNRSLGRSESRRPAGSTYWRSHPC